MLLKISYLLMRWSFGLVVLVFRGDEAKDAELLVLRHENAVLRRNAGRVRYEPADRAWFAALGPFIPRRQWAGIFPVTPATLLAWHRKLIARKNDTSTRRRPGRPVGAEYPVTLCDLGIFADQAAEPVPPQDPDIRVHNGRTLTSSRRALAERPVRAMNVIVLDVLTQDQPQVPLASDQHPVQALTPVGLGNTMQAVTCVSVAALGGKAAM